MLRVKMSNGQTLKKGLTIEDASGNYIVTSVDDGHVFINDAEQLSGLYAIDDNNNRLCKINYSLPEKRDEEAFYEEINGVCQ